MITGSIFKMASNTRGSSATIPLTMPGNLPTILVINPLILPLSSSTLNPVFDNISARAAIAEMTSIIGFAFKKPKTPFSPAPKPGIILDNPLKATPIFVIRPPTISSVGAMTANPPPIPVIIASVLPLKFEIIPMK